MNCDKCTELISPYIDGELSEKEKIEFESHLNNCSECKEEYYKTLEVIKNLKLIEQEPLPDDYKTTLRSKLKEEKKLINKPSKYKKWVGLGIAASLILFIFIAPGILYFSNSNSGMEYGLNESADMARDGSTEQDLVAEQEMADSVERDNGQQSTALVDESNRKIIKNAHIRIETLEFNKNLKEISEYINSQNGYIQNSNIHTINRDKGEYKEGHIILRVPGEKLQEVLDVISEKGKVNNISINSDDITKFYMDSETRLKNLEVQEERLRELMDEAQSIEDIVNIENELMRIRTEIEQIQGVLKNWDDLITLSTINLELIEVDKIDNKIGTVDRNIFEEGKKGFISTINTMIRILQSSLVFIITIIPLLILLGVLILSFYMWKKRKRD